MTALTFVLVVLLSAMTYGYLWERAKRKQRGILGDWPVRKVRVTELDPAFAQGRLGPALGTEVSMVGGADTMMVPGGTSDAEAWILAVLSKNARLMFEFGTCTGRTTYLWARNSPPDARIVTLTLKPGEFGEYRREPGDSAGESRVALEESAFDSFYYSNTDVAEKVTQLFGDSKTFDETPWAGECDLVFVDGSHALSYVLSDSRKALRLVKPGGLVLWHDYRGRRIPGVYKGLNALAKEMPLVHVANTSIVAYRRPL